MTDYFFDISCKFLNLSSVCIDSDDLKKRLCSQSTYPTLKALTNVLSDLDVEYRALRIDVNQLQELGTPALLHYNRGRKQQFVIATNVSENRITYYNDNLQKESKSIDEFSEHWDGVALYVFTPEVQSYICRISENFKKWRGFSLILLTIVGILIILSVQMVNAQFYIFLLLKLIGLFFSILLFRHDLGLLSKTEQQICSLSKKVSCDAVLSSTASKLFGLIKMSDIGIVYFSGGFILLMTSMLIGTMPSVMSVLSFFSLCSVPYVLFSLSYQKFKVKKWCPLCLGVISVLLMEIVFALILFRREQLIFPKLSYVVVLIFIFIWIALFWERMNGYMKLATKANTNEIRFLALKRNSTIFRTLLDNQPTLNMMFSEYDIQLGKLEAPIIITIAINPFCLPCLELYEQLLDTLGKRPDIFQLNIRFMSMDEEERNEPIGLRLMTAYFQDKEQFIEMFEFWKEDRRYSSFIANFENSPISDFARKALEHHLAWRIKYNINTTPMIFVNNKRIPDIYLEEDLLYFLQHNE